MFSPAASESLSRIALQFLLAKEESPRVLVQSHSMVVTPPPVGAKPGALSLSVEGTAWPPHRYVVCVTQ